MRERAIGLCVNNCPKTILLRLLVFWLAASMQQAAPETVIATLALLSLIALFMHYANIKHLADSDEVDLMNVSVRAYCYV